MNDLMELIGEALDAGEPIDNVIPYDLRGYPMGARIQILSIYATYGTDPERVKVCNRKLKEMFSNAGGTDSL